MPPRARRDLPAARLDLLMRPAGPFHVRRARAQLHHDGFKEERNDAFRMYERANPGLLVFEEMLRLPAPLLPRPGGPLGGPANPLDAYCDRLFNFIIDRVYATEIANGVAFGPRAWVRIGLHSMGNHYFISTPMIQMADFNVRTLLRMFRGPGNEDDQDDYDNMMEAEYMSIVMIANPDGSGKHSVRYKPEDELFYTGFNGKVLIKSHSFEGDHMCAQRSLVLLWLRKKDATAFTRLNRPASASITSKAYNELKEKCLVLSAEAGVNPNEPVTFADLLKLRKVLSERMNEIVHIIVVDAEKNMEIVYRTLNNRVSDKNIVWFTLVLRKGHYDAAPRIHKLMHGQKHFCFTCFKTYNNKHVCEASEKCVLCDHVVDHTKTGHMNENIYCDYCFRTFSGPECFRKHKENKICSTTWKCPDCFVVFQRPLKPNAKPSKGFCLPDNHICHDVWCSNCKDYRPKNHPCYLKCLKPQSPYCKYVFADFETDQSTGEHIVNLAVTFEFDGTEWPVFYNIHDWVQHMLKPEHKGKTFIFHNGRGFDFHPILNELMLIGRCVKPIMTGRKVIFMNVPDKRLFSSKSGRRFIDSVNFLPMPLKAFSKTFGLNQCKGHYPHFFNTTSNANYIGDVPDKKFYGYDTMTAKDQKDFDEWYVEESITKKGVWNNKHELLDYCRKDVILLMEGCKKFRDLVMTSVDGHDPFQCQTLSGSAMTIFKSLFMEEETIAAFKVNVARDLRSAFNGGRTEAFKLYKKCTAEERIAYVDFTSLYPFCNAKCRYPLGHPSVLNDVSLSDINLLFEDESLLAVLEVDVECPRHLYCPLLHSQDKDGLLMFDLRFKKRLKYTNLELMKAVSLGYKIVKVYKVWLWRRTKVGLFADYMKRFLKIKQEAAGWPSPDMKDEDKQAYIKDFEEAEGIKLNVDKIQNNDGLYKMSKLYLNSLWGKFAQRNPDMFDRTDIIHDTEQGQQDFNELRSEGRITDCYVVNEKTCLVKSKPAVLNDDESLGSINISIGIFTTAHARLKLYNEFLEPCGHRLLYCDTDSCIFYHSIHEDPSQIIKLGNYLGDPTSEVGDKSRYDEVEWIDEFVSGGPKHYAYKTNKNKSVIKVKGLNLKQKLISETISFDLMKRIVLSPHDHAIVFHSREIRINQEHELVNQEVEKTYQLNFTKRKILHPNNENGLVDTEPWMNDDDIGQVKMNRKKSKRKRDQFETCKGWPIYFARLDEQFHYYHATKVEPIKYFMVLYNFADEQQQNQFLNSTCLLECKSENDVFSVVCDKVKRDWIINVRTSEPFFDSFNGCRVIKHVYNE